MVLSSVTRSEGARVGRTRLYAGEHKSHQPIRDGSTTPPRRRLTCPKASGRALGYEMHTKQSSRPPKG